MEEAEGLYLRAISLIKKHIVPVPDIFPSQGFHAPHHFSSLYWLYPLFSNKEESQHKELKENNETMKALLAEISSDLAMLYENTGRHEQAIMLNIVIIPRCHMILNRTLTLLLYRKYSREHRMWRGGIIPSLLQICTSPKDGSSIYWM